MIFFLEWHTVAFYKLERYAVGELSPVLSGVTVQTNATIQKARHSAL